MKTTLSVEVGERMQYIAHKFNDTTIRFILKYPGLLSPETLCAATGAVVGSVDVLHSSFVAGKTSVHWQVNSDYDAPDYFSFVSCCGDPVAYAKNIALHEIEHGAKCQLHVTQINGEDCCAVVLRISHLVVDGSDGKYLLNKLAEAYRLIEQSGTAEGLTVKNGNRSATRAYDTLSKEELRSLRKSPFGSVKTVYPFEDVNDHGPNTMMHCTIPADTLASARQKAKAQGATVNDLITTACHRSFSKAAGKMGLTSVSAMMDLRQHCKNGDSEGLSNMSGGLATVLDVTGKTRFADDLKTVTEQTSAVKKNPLAGLDGVPYLHMAVKAFPIRFLLWAADFIYRSMSLSITNLGNIPCEPLKMGGLVPAAGIFGGPLKLKPSVQVSVASFDGTAELTILGDYTKEDTVSLQVFLDGILEEIESYLEET